MKTFIRYQFGELPDILKPCIASQEAFAARMDAEMIVITEIPEKFNLQPIIIAPTEENKSGLIIPAWELRTIKDYMCMEYLSQHPYTFTGDWDCDYPEDFTIPDIEEYYYGRCIDNTLYNGNNCEKFKQAFDLMSIRVEDRHQAEGTIYKAWRDIGIEPNRILTNYIHLNYHKNGVQNG